MDLFFSQAGLSAFSWAAVASLLFVGAWALRGAQPTGGRVVLRLPLEPRRSVYVLELAGRHLVLGSTEGGIQLLAELDAAEASRLSATLASPVPAPWQALLARWSRT